MFHANSPHTVLSERLHNYLRRKELTHAEFAKLAGIGTSTVTRCLNNDYIPSTEVYRKIAAVMKVEPETLAKHEPKASPCEKQPDELEKAYSAIDTIREQRDAALKGWTEANHIARSANDLAKRAHEAARRFFAIYFALGMFFGATALMLIVALLS